MKRRIRRGIYRGISLIALPGAVHAQDTSNNHEQVETMPAEAGIETIVVTAERRASDVQKTPVSVTALGGDDLQASGIANVEALNGSVPGLSFSRTAGDAKIFIRGVGYDSIAPGGETRVAYYQDGIYQSRTQAALLGFYDVERIEVLRGPQGTLYGRNAIAGTINVISRDPTYATEGYVTGTVGTYGLFGAEGAIGGEIGGGIAGRLSFKTSDRGGYGENIGTGEDVGDEQVRAIRAKLRADASDSLTIRFEADYALEDDHSGGYRYIGPARPGLVPVGIAQGGAVPEDPQDSAGFGPKNRIEAYGAFIQADWDIAPGTAITSLTGYRHLEQFLQSNVDGTTEQTNRQYITEDSDTVSQEVRLSTEIGTIADLILGGYYFHETNEALNEVPFAGYLGGLPTSDLYEGYGTSGRVKTDAYAAFGQANIHLADALQLDLGLRYSSETKTITEAAQFDFTNPFEQGSLLAPFGTLTQRLKVDSLDPKATLSYEFAPRVFGYATFSRGFKSGGFNVGGLQPAFKPEKLTNYEVGLKADAFDRRVRANLSAFYYDYSQLQVNIVEGVQLVTKNAASAEVKGLEAEITLLPTDDLRITVNAAYLDATYKEFNDVDQVLAPGVVQDLSGNRLNNAPRYTVDASVGYTFHFPNDATLTPRVNGKWIDRLYFSQFNTPGLSQPSRFELNLFLDWEMPSQDFRVSAYVRNATDATYIVGSTYSTPFVGAPIVGQYGAPLTAGLVVTKNF